MVVSVMSNLDKMHCKYFFIKFHPHDLYFDGYNYLNYKLNRIYIYIENIDKI